MSGPQGLLTEDQRPHKGELREDNGQHCHAVECWCWDDRYQVVTRETLEDLHHAVNAFIHQKGWRPLGGISQSDRVWAQAMVRYL